MSIDDSVFLEARIRFALDKDNMFGYTSDQKIEKLKNLKAITTNELQNWMYPQKETEKLKKLLNDIDSHLIALNG